MYVCTYVCIHTDILVQSRFTSVQCSTDNINGACYNKVARCFTAHYCVYPTNLYRWKTIKPFSHLSGVLLRRNIHFKFKMLRVLGKQKARYLIFFMSFSVLIHTCMCVCICRCDSFCKFRSSARACVARTWFGGVSIYVNKSSLW